MTSSGRIEIFRNFLKIFQKYFSPWKFGNSYLNSIDFLLSNKILFCFQLNARFLNSTKLRSVRRPVTFWAINTTSVQLPVTFWYFPVSFRTRGYFENEKSSFVVQLFLSELLYLFLHSSYYILELHTFLHTLLHINICKIVFCQPLKLGFKKAQWTIT